MTHESFRPIFYYRLKMSVVFYSIRKLGHKITFSRFGTTITVGKSIGKRETTLQNFNYSLMSL